MTLPVTETLPEGAPIDALPSREAVPAMVDAQLAAVRAVDVVKADIVRASEAMAEGFRAGGSLHYVAAGSSGLMALADASELPGTFGIEPKSIKIHMAGGVPVDGHMPGDTEDDTKAVDAVGSQIAGGDVVIVLTASGSTPYAVEIARKASALGATVIGIANNPGAALFAHADIQVCIATPPEVVAGSTRLGAGTAQKVALNLMSTLMGIALGHVYQGEMVNVVADNAKLVRRSARMVARIAGVPEVVAEDAIAQANGNAKIAILIASGATPASARELLVTHVGRLGPCLEAIKSIQNQDDLTGRKP